MSIKMFPDQIDRINALIEYLELIFKEEEEEEDKYSEEYYQVLRERNEEEELRVEASKWLYHHLGRRGSFSAGQLPYVENINFKIISVRCPTVEKTTVAWPWG